MEMLKKVAPFILIMLVGGAGYLLGQLDAKKAEGTTENNAGTEAAGKERNEGEDNAGTKVAGKERSETEDNAGTEVAGKERSEGGENAGTEAAGKERSETEDNAGTEVAGKERSGAGGSGIETAEAKEVEKLEATNHRYNFPVFKSKDGKEYFCDACVTEEGKPLPSCIMSESCTPYKEEANGIEIKFKISKAAAEVREITACEGDAAVKGIKVYKAYACIDKNSPNLLFILPKQKDMDISKGRKQSEESKVIKVPRRLWEHKVQEAFPLPM